MSSRRRVLRCILALFAVAVGALLIAAASQWRNPSLVGRGPVPQVVSIALIVTTMAVAATSVGRVPRLVSFLMVLLPLAAASWAGVLAYEASSLRSAVVSLPRGRLRHAASHVVAGFYTMDEARLLAKAGVAGLFLSPRNVRGRTVEAVAADVAALQALRRDEGLAPLWIASDQEGGFVASLSPPLTRPKPIAAFASDEAAMIKASETVARDLVRMGVNVNFAPVVDVTRGFVDPNDLNSRIALRSLSPDPTVVTAGAAAYCRGLATLNVQCTIKHFPGLGAVTIDTHVAAAHIDDIDPRDLAPFRALTSAGGPRPWLMIGHVFVDRLDADRPASASPSVIAIVRKTFGYDGILITDDAAMAPYRAHLAADVAGTLEGGADLVLASWDPDVAFEVIAIVADFSAEDTTIVASDRRLVRRRTTGRIGGL